MSKTKALKIVNPILFLLVLNQLIGAFLYHDISRQMFIWGHKRAGLLLGFFILVHLVLNWSWIKANCISPGKAG